MATLNLYSPITAEDEFEQLINRQGKYIPDFQVDNLNKTGTSGSDVSGADFVFDMTAFGISGSISSGSATDVDYTANVFNYLRPGKFSQNQQGKYYYTPEVHGYANRLFRHIPLHSALGVENLPGPGRVLDVEVIAIPCNWIKVSGNSIVQVSPAIKKAVERWRAKHNNATPKNTDYLGTIPYGFPCEPGKGYVSTDAVEIDFVRNTVIGSPKTSILIVGSLDTSISNTYIGLNPNSGKYLIHDRGLTEYGTPDPAKPAPTINVNLTEINNLLIRGTSSQKNWYVTISLDALGVQETVPTNPFDGSWSYKFSAQEIEYIKENKIDIASYRSQVKLLLHEKQDPGYVATSAAKQDPDVVQVQGIPREVMYDNGRFVKIISSGTGNSTSLVANNYITGYVAKVSQTFFNYSQEYYKDKSTDSVPMISALKRTSAVNEEVSKMFLGTYIGTNDATADKLFISTPGSVIDMAGVDVFVKTYERAYNAPSTLDSSVQPNFHSTFSHSFSMAFGVYGAEYESERISLSWRKEISEFSKDRYQLRWSKNAPADIDTYSLRWSTGYEPREYQDRYRFRFSSEGVSWTKEEYLLRWNVELPEVDEDRVFYDFSWSHEQVQELTDTYRFRYTKEMTKTFRDTYSLKWSVPNLDEVIVKPFYIKDGDRHHISYMVYGSKAVNEYIQDDSLTFYFSNPSKYELVKFNRDAEPYKDIFIKEFKDPSLNSREGIPLDYMLIGNYTVLDINVKNSLSLDVVADNKQLNEFRSYWLPDDLTYFDGRYYWMTNGMQSSELVPVFRDDHHIDVVELEVDFINEVECCFTQKSVGTRCSPY